MNKVQSDVLATHGAWNDMYVTQVPVPTATFGLSRFAIPALLTLVFK